MIFSRPNFFEGQFLSPQDFNKLSEFPENYMAHFFKSMLPTGGIVLGISHNLEVEILSDRTLKIHPGLAFDQSGKPIVLKESIEVDLSEYFFGPQILRIELKSDEELKEFYQDPEFSEIKGHRNIEKTSLLCFSAVEAEEEDLPPNGGVEICRIHMESKSPQTLAFLEGSDLWREGHFKNGVNLGYLDLRYRLTMRSSHFEKIPTMDLISSREQLFSIELGLKKIESIFSVRNESEIFGILLTLHGEILSRPLQPEKFYFFLKEFASRMSDFLSELENKRSLSRSDLNRDSLIELVTYLKTFKQKDLLYPKIDLAPLKIISEKLKLMLDFTDIKFSLKSSLSSQIEELRDRPLKIENNISMAGHSFSLVKNFRPDQDMDSEMKSLRTVSAQYLNGTQEQSKGLHLEEGTVGMQFSLNDKDRPLIFLSKEFLRREPGVITFQVNGTDLDRFVQYSKGIKNAWLNYGVFIPTDLLVLKNNKIIITVQDTEIDYGVFDAFLYQLKE